MKEVLNIKTLIEPSIEKLSDSIEKLYNSLNGTHLAESVTSKNDSSIGKVISQGITEGFHSLGGYLKGQVQSVLSPVEDITTPVLSLGKGLVGMTTNLFSRSSTRDDSRMSDDLHKIRVNSDKTLDMEKRRSDLKPDNKGGMFTKVFLPIAALVIGFFKGLIDSFKMIITPFKSLFTGIFNLPFLKGLKSLKPIQKFFGFFKTLGNLVKSTPLSRFVGSLGKFFGGLIVPFLMAWEGIKGWIEGKNLRDKILGAASGMLGTFLEFPQWVTNKILGLFTNFKVDFSAQSITDSVNGLTSWIEKNVTARIFDFINVTVPDFISTGLGTMINDLQSMFTSALGSTLNFATMIKDEVIEIMISLVKSLPYGERFADKLNSYKSSPVPSQVKVSKEIPMMVTHDKTALYQGEMYQSQLKGNKEIYKELQMTNQKIDKTNEINSKVYNSQQNIQINNNKDDIPSDIESMGILFMNKSHGLG